MSFTGNGITNCYPDQVDNFISITVLRAAGLRAEVFVWDDFHDRYLISNLIGISLSNGFDTKANQTTTWTRLGRKDRDDVRREFHPATGSHKLQLRFEVG